MNEFNEYELQDYDKKEKSRLQEKAEEINSQVKDLTIILDTLADTNDKHEILEKGYSIYFRANDMRQAYFNIINLKECLGIISDEEANKIRKEGYETPCEDMYWRIKDFNIEEYNNKIENSTFMPKKGSYGYCKCKGYNYLSRVEMGKLIKKDLRENYPECDFSVTTDGGYWRDSINIRFSKAPEELFGNKNYDGKQGIKESTIREIQDFCMEYEPRVSVSVNGYIW